MKANLLSNAHTNEDSLTPELQKLLNSISTVKKMDIGTYLFQEGADAHYLYIIRSGLVQISKLTSDGKEMILRICNENDLIGELTLFNDNPQYLLSAKVLRSGEVFVINKNQLEEALKLNNDLTLEFMKWTSNHMRKLQLKIRDLLFYGKKGALYSTLIRLANSYGIKKGNGVFVDMALTNRELAKFCNATRESVNHLLVELRKIDVISIDNTGRILIKDMQYLRDKIGCENCPIEVCNIN